MPDRTPFPYVVGVDTGGTFTDFVFLDESGTVRVDKRPSLPDDPALPVLEGLPPGNPDAPYRVVHGTTVATNALLERKTASVALITTAGFEDVLEIGRQNRPELYAIHPRKVQPLVPRELRFGVRERILVDGTVRTPLNAQEVRDLLRRIRELPVQAVAVCLLHSYANPVHEEMIGELAAQEGVPVSLSTRVSREFREYERTATVAVNAALIPIMQGYLDRLERGTKTARLSVMQSAGGMLPPRIAARLPVHTILSGPAGGVIAAGNAARMMGLDRIITFDMGGTSTDVSLYDRSPSEAREKVIAGYPVHVPVIDIHTVGAGGGSIAFRDPGGGLKVGPASAGADPGPVCYGKGNAITVTDANLFLGRMEPSFFLGGRMKIDQERVRGPLEALGQALGLAAHQTAEGIITVANSVMERAIRVISIERGHDPRTFSLVSFGGSGGLHAVELARALGIPTVVVPRDAGVFSALGMALADVRRDYSRTVLRSVAEFPAEEMDGILETMVRAGRDELAEEGIPPDAIVAQAALDMRYRGQSHEITVPLDEDPVSAFHGAHERRLGFKRLESPVEIVTLRVRLLAESGGPRISVAEAQPRPFSARPTGRKHIPVGGALAACHVYDRAVLLPGAVLESPAIVVESTSTTFLPGGSRAQVDRLGSIIVQAG